MRVTLSIIPPQTGPARTGGEIKKKKKSNNTLPLCFFRACKKSVMTRESEKRTFTDLIYQVLLAEIN